MIDLDETLVDREAVLADWAGQMAASAGGDPALRDWLIAHDKVDGRIRERTEYLQAAGQRIGLTDPLEIMQRRWLTEFATLYRLDDETRRALEDARDAGCRLAVVTNGATAAQSAKLRAMGIEQFVDAWVISEDAGVNKPDAAIFELAAERAGTTLEDAWMMGDSPVADIGGAWSIGATPVWVNRTQKPWPDGHRRAAADFDHPAPAIRHVLAQPVR